MSTDYTTLYNYKRFNGGKYGSPATHEQLAKAAALTGYVVNRRHFGGELYLLALMLRPDGCSMNDFTNATSHGPAFNKVRKVWRAGLITINGERCPGPHPNNTAKINLPANVAMVAALTPTGERVVGKYDADAAPVRGIKAKPAKKAISKPRKPKAVPATVSEPPAVEPVANPPAVEPVA